MRDLFRGFGAVFYKEALHVRRDPATLFFSLLMPVMQMLLLGFGIDTNGIISADGQCFAYSGLCIYFANIYNCYGTFPTLG